MDADTLTKIDTSRTRLQQFVANATDADLTHPVEGDWPVFVHLVHLAFFDRRAAGLLRRAQHGNLAPSPIDPDSINEAALHHWRLIPPRAAAQEAIDAAEEVDSLVSGLSSDIFTALREAKSDIRFDRSHHRDAHLDQIESSLGRT